MPHEIEKLLQGYRAFREQYFSGKDLLFSGLVRNGQSPKILVIACSDSRVDPAIITNSQPGDLFVVRNVANLVPPYEQDNSTHHGTSAALEFAIRSLGVRHVIVFGHSQCGGVQALMSDAGNVSDQNSFIGKWMQLAQPARQWVVDHHAAATTEQQVEFCCQQSLIHSLQNLRTFPWIKEKIAESNLFLHAWYFNLAAGEMSAFNEAQQNFLPL